MQLYNDCLRGFINENDKTPLWDGFIYIYRNQDKKNKDFEGKIDVQIKGRKVKEFNDKNVFSIDITTLKGYQKEIKGTLLLVVDIIDSENSKIYYCNLLPVDLHGIFSSIKDDQKHVNLNLKPIIRDSAITLKNVCLNFYANSKKQAGKKIVNESDFNKLENMNFTVLSNKEHFYDYIIDGDVYNYAILKDTKEEVVTVRGMSIVPFSEIKRNSYINGKHYYSKISVYGRPNEETWQIGPVTIDFTQASIHLDFSNNLDQKIKELDFCYNLLKYRYITIDDNKLDFPFTDENKIEKNMNIFNLEFKDLKNIKEVFKYFGIKFDVPIDKLTNEDRKNIYFLRKLYNGDSSEKMEFKKYYIDINKYLIIFIPDIERKKVYNYFSDELIDSIICYTKNNEKIIKHSIYENICETDILSSNFNDKVFLRSLKNIDICDEVLDSINNILLRFLCAFDKTKNKKYLQIADKLSLLNCKNRNNDIDIINSKQIKFRKKRLSIQDKKILSEISSKLQFKNNILIQCSISILLENNYTYIENYKLLTKKEKNMFKNFPIFNLLNKSS